MKVLANEIHVPAEGIVINTTPTIWYDPDRHQPPLNTELLVVLRDPRYADLLREYCEYRCSGWCYVGDLAPVPDVVLVLLWAEPPAVPAIDEVQGLVV